MNEVEGSSLSLEELAREIPGGAEIAGDGAVRVRGVHHDSRIVQPGDLFVARRGVTSDGARFLEDAAARGAVAVLAARGAFPAAATALSVLWVDDAAIGLAHAAAAICGHPSFALDVVGVTGTNGKTTTTHLVRAALDGALGVPACGIIGTIGSSFAGEAAPPSASHTTPEADDLARTMAWMRRRGAGYVAMEVSSHAVALKRVLAVRFRVAAFTNLTRDHLDFHGTMEAYADAKARLFLDHGPAVAVVNVASDAGRDLATRIRAARVTRVISVTSRPGEPADVAPIDVDFGARGLAATISTPEGTVSLRSRLVGAHNLENLVVTLGIVHALELDLGRAVRALASEPGAPGRLERVDVEDDVTVLVDYAHTPDALERVLASVRAFAPGRVVCVFGCGGDRDPSKRAPMGEAAARGSDVCVLTSDNPRTEDPRAIADEAEAGIRAAGTSPVTWSDVGAGARGFVVELDRRAAIEAAIASALPGDVIVLAGKGHEDHQIIGREKRPFDDREEARRALARRRRAVPR